MMPRLPLREALAAPVPGCLDVDEGGLADTADSSERGLMMPTLKNALLRYFAECEVDWRARSFLDAAE